MKRKISALLLALVLTVSLALPVSAAFHSEVKNSVAVVAVCLDLSTGEELLCTGSGFFVGEEGKNPTHLLTNYHVIENFVENHAGELFTMEVKGVEVSGRAKVRVYFDSKTYADAYTVDYDKTRDVAILRLAEATDLRQPIALRSPDTSLVGSDIYAVGYPGISENSFAAATSHWGIDDASVTSGTISRILTSQGTGMVNLQIDCEIRSGNSGGPLVNEAGEVLGINTWSAVTGADKLNYAVSIAEAIPLLLANRIPFMEVSGQKNAGGIPAAALIAAGVGILVVILILVLLMKKKKAVPAPVSAPQVPYVRSLAAQHGGIRVPLQNRTIVIGRSHGECSLVYSEATPGVSSRHCSLSWDGSAFILTDLGSTYGTFVHNNVKLEPGVPCALESGSTFWLGDRQNILRLELE